jgi:hypothetical protein
MTKFLRKMMFLLFIAFIGISSFGFSYWYFDNKQEKSTSLNQIKADDIKENYDFGQDASDKAGKTYTIYFFPSAAYMYLYHDYVAGNTTDAPEQQFGYKEPLYNSDGSLKTDNNGNVIYKLSDNTGKVSYSDHKSSQGTITYDGAYRKYMAEKFNCNNFEADGGSAYASNSAYTQSQSYLSSNKLAMRTWGIPNDAFTINESDANRVENFNGRNQYSTDRFGCWGDCYYYGQTISDSGDDQAPTGLIQGADTSKPSSMDDTNTGRYLPIKLTVTNELMSSVMEMVVQSIFTSMGTLYNDSYYHNYTFTEWTYVTNVKNPSSIQDSDYPYSYVNNTGDWQANKIGEAFQPKQRDRYFDMFSDLDQYADNNNVIRLYPLFSNGKKNGGYEDGVTDSAKYTLGGGSTEKLTITTSSNTEYKYPFFNSDVYNNGKGNFTYTDENGKTQQESLLPSEYINLFSYNNIEVSNDTTSLVFSANNIWNSPCGWGKNSDGTLFWQKQYTLNADYIKKNLISNYGEGLYTFYVIVANYSYQNGPSNSSTNSETTMKGTFDTFYKNIASQLNDGAFTCLTGKRLVQITSTDDEYDSYKCSPTVVVFEKIDEPNIITTDSVPSNITSFVSSSTGRSFYKNVNKLYQGTHDNSNYSIKGDDLSSTSPYTYLIKNIDLTSDDHFVISINTTDTSTTYINSDSSKVNYEYLICTTDETNFKSSEVYTNALGDNGYIELASGSDDTKTVFKLKDNTSGESYYGIYDILIKYNDDINKYDIYMYRHDTKMFLYVFDNDLTSTTTEGFVDYTTTADTSNVYKTSNGDTLLFDNDTYMEGISASKDDTSSKANASKTLDECIRYYVSGKTDGEIASYTYSGAELLNYRLIDRVSGEVVGYYQSSVDDNGTTTYTLAFNLKMSKNHILYVQHLTNN